MRRPLAMTVLALLVLVSSSAAHANSLCTPQWRPARLSPVAYHASAFDAARGVTVVFGGFEAGFHGETWTWDGSDWRLVAAQGPSARHSAAMVYDSARGVVVLFGGDDGQNADLNDTWEWDGQQWTLVKPLNSPPGRSLHAMAYDSARGVTVLFGGFAFDGNLSDTWEYDGLTWTNVSAPGPTARNAHRMAYDSVRGTTLLFGGSEGLNALDELWGWDGSDWTLLSVGVIPGRFLHAMSFDSVRGRLVVHGGSTGSLASDTWEWSGTSWSLVASGGIGQPGGRYGHTLSFDSARGRTVFFAGLNGAGLAQVDSWEWNGTAWSPTPVPPAGPTGRNGAAIAFDRDRGRAVLYGGQATGGTLLDDTWEWNGGRWTLRAQSSGPLKLMEHRLAYDTARQRTLLVGGLTSGPIYDTAESWTWNGLVWSYRGAADPTPREGHAVDEDSSRQRVVLFGGGTSAATGNLLRGDTWEWDGAHWSQLTTIGPSPRSSQMACDDQRSRCVLFGGRSAAGWQGDTWEWGGASWLLRATTGPAARSAHGMAFDEASGLVTVVGGVNATATLSDTWGWDGQRWTQFGASLPTGRSAFALTYDPQRRALLLFGGQTAGNSTFQNDTWLFFPGTELVEQPVSQLLVAGGSASFGTRSFGRPATGYRWRKDGVPLDDGPSGVGSMISGAHTASLTISNLSDADVGQYDCVVAAPCGETTSDAATLGYRFWLDQDGDGYGTPATSQIAMSPPTGYVDNDLDCNDANVTIYSGAPELCDGLDNDCDLVADNAPAPTARPFLEVSAGVLLDWSITASATSYDVARGRLSALLLSGGDFGSPATTCLADDLVATTLTDPTLPTANDGFFYLVRPVSCGGSGSWEEGGRQIGARDPELTSCP